jgi:hypothetical protein
MRPLASPISLELARELDARFPVDLSRDTSELRGQREVIDLILASASTQHNVTWSRSLVFRQDTAGTRHNHASAPASGP